MRNVTSYRPVVSFRDVIAMEVARTINGDLKMSESVINHNTIYRTHKIININKLNSSAMNWGEKKGAKKLLKFDGENLN